MTRFWLVGFAGALWAFACLPHAAAQSDTRQSIDDDEARALFDSATLALEAGRHEEALERFREALRLSGRPVLYYNIGIVADRLRRNEEALEAFRHYLEEVPNGPNRRDVEARIRVLEQSVAREREAANASGANRAPSPEEAARIAAQQDANAAETAEVDTAADSESGSILSRWWFWTIVGVVVAGGVTVGVALAVSSGGLQDPIAGSNGVTYQTLVGPP